MKYKHIKYPKPTSDNMLDTFNDNDIFIFIWIIIIIGILGFVKIALLG